MGRTRRAEDADSPCPPIGKRVQGPGTRVAPLDAITRVGTRVEVPSRLFCGLAFRSARFRLTGRRLWHDREPGANKFFQPDETRPAGLPFSDSQHRASLLDEPKELRLSFRRWNFQEKQLLSFDDHIGKRQANREKHDL